MTTKPNCFTDPKESPVRVNYPEAALVVVDSDVGQHRETLISIEGEEVKLRADLQMLKFLKP